MHTQHQPEPIFIGLDLSLTSTGVAVAHRGHIVTARVVSKPAGGTSADTAERLLTIVTGIFDHIPTTEHTRVAIEGPSFGSKGGSAHERAGLFWTVRLKLARRGIDTIVIPPTSVKKYATENGTAPKKDVLAAVRRRFPGVAIDGFDEADALAIVSMCARYHGAPLEPDLHGPAIDAMRGVGR